MYFSLKIDSTTTIVNLSNTMTLTSHCCSCNENCNQNYASAKHKLSHLLYLFKGLNENGITVVCSDGAIKTTFPNGSTSGIHPDGTITLGFSMGTYTKHIMEYVISPMGGITLRFIYPDPDGFVTTMRSGKMNTILNNPPTTVKYESLNEYCWTKSQFIRNIKKSVPVEEIEKLREMNVIPNNSCVDSPGEDEDLPGLVGDEDSPGDEDLPGLMGDEDLQEDEDLPGLVKDEDLQEQEDLPGLLEEDLRKLEEELPDLD
jgi:hypothetical protein